MERRIRPQVPAMAKMTSSEEEGVSMGFETHWHKHVIRVMVQRKIVLDRPLSIFSAMPRFLARRPVCRSHRSEAKLKSRKTVVTVQPAMNNGFNP